MFIIKTYLLSKKYIEVGRDQYKGNSEYAMWMNKNLLLNE